MAPTMRAERPAIAVLPFMNASGEPEQDYFADGISEDIITELSRLRWFLVIARNSSFAYRGRPVTLRQVGEELGVGYLVEGSVRKSGEHVRITAQLNEVATGKQLWAERYDRRLSDVFAIQDEITEAVVAAIEPQVWANESFQGPAQGAGEPRRLGPGHARPAALLARDQGGPSTRPPAAGTGDRHRSELCPGAGGVRGQHHVRRPHGLGGRGSGRARRRALRPGRGPRRR